MESLGGVVFSAPFAAGDFEKTGSMNDVVADADDGGIAGGIVAGGGETDAGVKLGEERFNGRRWIPRCMHAKLVGVQFVLRNFTVVGPEMGEDGEAGDMAIAEGGIVKILNVVVGDGCDDLGAKSLVDFVVGSEDGAGASVDAVEFGDLMGGKAGGVFADRSGIDGWKKRDVEEESVFGGREGEANVAMEAVAAVRWDRGGVGVELGLSDT